MAASLWPDPDAARTLALPVVPLWLFAAAGVARLLDAAGDRAVHRIALVLLMLMLPWLLWARGAPPSDEPDELGYARVTREDVAAMRLAMPRGASLVRDETVTEVLWRSLHDTRVTFVPADRLQVREALTAGPVYALPRTTRALGRVGIRFEPGGRLDPPGLARATAASLCTPVGAEPREMALPADAIGLTLVADAPDARGPIAVSAASDAPLRFARLDWPRSAERGFFTSGLDVSGAERLEIWRTPDAPRVLTVSVKGTPARLVIRSLTDDDEPLAVCAAFALPLRPLGPMER
jgi:hypothetical protein